MHEFNLFRYIWCCFLVSIFTCSSIPLYLFVIHDTPHFLLLSPTEDHKPFLHIELSPDLLQCFAIKKNVIIMFCTVGTLPFYPMMKIDPDDILYIFFIHTMYYIQTNHSQNCTNRAHWSWQFLKFCLLIGKHFLLSTSYIIGKIILSPIKHLHFLDVAYNTQSCPVRLSCSFWKKITFVSWKLYIKYTNIYKQTIHMWMCCWNLGLHNDKPSINYKKHDTSTHIMIAYTQMKKNV
jgi:hypothetical protein